VFFRSPGTDRSGIPVEVTGNTENELEVRFDDRSFQGPAALCVLPPFPAGPHTLRVKNCGEKEEIRFSAEQKTGRKIRGGDCNL
jgi:hypothetical protein